MDCRKGDTNLSEVVESSSRLWGEEIFTLNSRAERTKGSGKRERVEHEKRHYIHIQSDVIEGKEIQRRGQRKDFQDASVCSRCRSFQKSLV